MYDPTFQFGEHVDPNGHIRDCVCDMCCQGDDIILNIFTCTCAVCDPARIAINMVDNHSLNNKPMHVANDSDSVTTDEPPDASPQKTSRVIKSYEIPDFMLDICEEPVGFCVSLILREDMFTGTHMFVLDLKEAEEVVAQYLAAMPCPKIEKPEAPVEEPARRWTWDDIITGAWCETYQSGQFDVPRQVLPSDGFTLDD